MPDTAGRAAERGAFPPSDSHLRFAASMVVAAIVIAGVYFARPVLVPLALAILLAFALAPVVTLLRRWRVGHVVSVLLATLFAMAAMCVVVLFIGTQLAHLAADLPHYQRNIAHKLRSLETSATSDNLIGRTSSLLDTLGNQLSAPSAGNGQIGVPGVQEERPVPVVIRQPAVSPFEIIENISRPLLDPLATGGIAIIFVVFILLQKEDLRDRFIWVAGTGDLQRAKIGLDDGASRVSRYLLTQTVINTVFGALVGTGLWLIGVPNPGLWGLLAMMLRFIPYVGVPLAAAMPLLLSLAVDPGWSKVFWTAGLYVGLEAITGQVVEPFLYGKSAGLSPLAVVAAATFWTWVWGPVGLLLSTPLTLCLAVLGRHVEHLRFLDVLLGNRPPLAHEESFYLRVLAGDPDNAALLAEAFLKEHSACEYYDIVLKALAFAQADVDRGALDIPRCNAVKELIDELIQNLSDHQEPAAGATALDQQPDIDGTGSANPHSLAGGAGQAVLCVAGRNVLDEAAALLLVDLLGKRGIGARVVSANEASSANVQRLDPSDVRFICLSYIDPGNGTNAHYLIRRLRRRIPGVQAIAGFWGLSGDNSRILDAVAATGCDIVTTLGEAMERITAAMNQPTGLSSPATVTGEKTAHIADAVA
ncbi:MAG TPA: AI-2E family transporter [Rhizomicrobium sp.]|jgi:predicted PurR-regulated permease PerM|nr:AI-2E family transporter [Rhizomicrobium sp.]